MQYYDEVEKKLTLVTNKIVTTHVQEGADLLNAEVRAYALHAFTSGLKKSLRAVVFPARAASQGKDNREEQRQDINPHFVRRPKGNTSMNYNNDNQAQAPQPMEVDASSRFRQRTEYIRNNPNGPNTYKRRNSSDRSTGPRRQRINNVVRENPKPQDPNAKDPKQEYENAAKAAVEDIDSDNKYAPSDDSLNFLGNAPGCRSLNVGWLGEL